MQLSEVSGPLCSITIRQASSYFRLRKVLERRRRLVEQIDLPPCWVRYRRSSRDDLVADFARRAENVPAMPACHCGESSRRSPLSELTTNLRFAGVTIDSLAEGRGQSIRSSIRSPTLQSHMRRSEIGGRPDLFGMEQELDSWMIERTTQRSTPVPDLIPRSLAISRKAI
jgi:hypothetical protein